MRHPDETKRGKPLRITIRYCDESELTTEERARMDAAREAVNRKVRELIGKICRERAAAAAAVK